MSEKIWPNSGRIFKNDSRKTERHPDDRGDGEVTCPHCSRRVLFFIDGWKKRGERGDWLSLSFKAKDKQPSASGDVRPPREEMDFGHTGGPSRSNKKVADDDIPF